MDFGMDKVLEKSAATVQARPAITLLFFASGFAALLYQIAWQRALFGWYGVDLDSVSVIVSVFMLGLGVGAFIGGWLADRFNEQRVFVFSLIELTIAVFGFFSLGIIDSIGAFFPADSIPRLVVLTFVVFVVPTCAMGATLDASEPGIPPTVALAHDVGWACRLQYNGLTGCAPHCSIGISACVSLRQLCR